MDSYVKTFLHRIEYLGPTAPTQNNLAELHQAHLNAVTFEDLDIHPGIKLSLELEHLKRKLRSPMLMEAGTRVLIL